jgi:hypothetical protein
VGPAAGAGTGARRPAELLLPLLGFHIAGCALCAIVYGLSTPRNGMPATTRLPADAPCGRTHWGTVAALATALLIGTGVLMASLVYSFQRY